jgi:hypothetical protein
MGRPPEDTVDRACALWAAQWVRAFGRAPQVARDALGPLGCTLGRVLERHDGAASGTERDRHFPEVFEDDGLIVACILKTLSYSKAKVIHVHYIERWYRAPKWIKQAKPVRQVVVAERAGWTLREYLRYRDSAKTAIQGALDLSVSEIWRGPRIGVQISARKGENDRV